MPQANLKFKNIEYFRYFSDWSDPGLDGLGDGWGRRKTLPETQGADNRDTRRETVQEPRRTAPIAQDELRTAPIAQDKFRTAPIAQDEFRTAPIAQNEFRTAPIPQNEFRTAPIPQNEFRTAPIAQAEFKPAPVLQGQLREPSEDRRRLVGGRRREGGGVVGSGGVPRGAPRADQGARAINRELVGERRSQQNYFR